MAQNTPSAKMVESEGKVRVTLGSQAASPTVTSQLSGPTVSSAPLLAVTLVIRAPSTKTLNYQCEQVQPAHFPAPVSSRPLCFLRQSWRAALNEDEMGTHSAWGSTLLTTAVTGGTMGQGCPAPWEKESRSTRMEKWRDIKEEQTRKLYLIIPDHIYLYFLILCRTLSLSYLTLTSPRQDCRYLTLTSAEVTK